MPTEQTSALDACGPGPPFYEIVLRGRLDESWSDSFGALELHVTPAGETVATGPIQDQAELHGLLERVRDMGIELLAVRRLDGPLT